MSNDCKSCCGQADSLQEGSSAIPVYKAAKGMWVFKNKGLVSALWLVFFKLCRILRLRNTPRAGSAEKKRETPVCEVLNLKAGELVEVKSEEEILAMLDHRARYKGLLWMPGMQKYCGKRFRVYKRLERILLESTGELRKIKNTVLLEGAVCDGEEYFGCDRSCLHFWREAWLRRTDENSK